MALLLPAAMHAQGADAEPRAAVTPDTVTVGDRFTAAVALDLAPGDSAALVVAPDSLGRYQAAGAPRLLLRGDGSRIAIATLVLWVTGAPDSARATLVVLRRTGKTERRAISIPLPFVRSVLPADTTKHRPRPAKDVYGPDRDWRLTVLAAAAALLLLGLLFLLLRKLRKKKPRALSPADARTRALAALERARASGTAEAGEWKAFYSQVSGALRAFAEDSDARWGVDLTTTELLARMRDDGVAEDDVRPLAGVLRDADLAKFARHPLTLETARRDWADAKAWVEAFRRPSPPPAEAPAAAGGAR